MASTDARPVPIKNTAFRIYFGYYKNDGTLITSLSSASSRAILDGTDGAATNTTTQVGTTGVFYHDFTTTEMNTDCTVFKFSDATAGAVPVVIALFPQETGDIKVDVTSWLGTAAATPTVAGVPEVDITHIAGSAVSASSAQLGVNVVQIDSDATAANRAKRAFGNMTLVTISTGSTSTSITTDLTEATNDQYKGRALYFLTGNLAGEIVEITAYNGTTKALTVTATPTGESPANSDVALIV